MRSLKVGSSSDSYLILRRRSDGWRAGGVGAGDREGAGSLCIAQPPRCVVTRGDRGRDVFSLCGRGDRLGAFACRRGARRCVVHPVTCGTALRQCIRGARRIKRGIRIVRGFGQAAGKPGFPRRRAPVACCATAVLRVWGSQICAVASNRRTVRGMSDRTQVRAGHADAERQGSDRSGRAARGFRREKTQPFAPLRTGQASVSRGFFMSDGVVSWSDRGEYRSDEVRRQAISL